jgi:DNA-binding response OmpR family regulator
MRRTAQVDETRARRTARTRRGASKTSEVPRPVPTTPHPHVPVAPAPHSIGAPAGYRILVIEDDPDLLSILRIAAEARGHKVYGAEDGQQGVTLARELVPDVILLDLMLPVMDGYKVLTAIRAEAATVSVPVVILTARATEGERKLGLALGADEYVTKPYNLRDVLGRVDALMTPRRTRSEAHN